MHLQGIGSWLPPKSKIHRTEGFQGIGCGGLVEYDGGQSPLTASSEISKVSVLILLKQEDRCWFTSGLGCSR